ncbi:hypothetical protein [Lysinibacillus sp. NPDC056185]|uniref:hypothetical protein n=1 Tax=Lysinibacillus sp. NPDC056185 TaxID=3345739 RepID=UPI0039EE61CB
MLLFFPSLNSIRHFDSSFRHSDRSIRRFGSSFHRSDRFIRRFEFYPSLRLIYQPLSPLGAP